MSSLSNGRRSVASLLLLAIGSCTQQSSEKSPEQIWKEASGSIVYVTAKSVDGKVAQGSGFFVKLEGKRWILTNRHVVNGAEEVSIAPQGKNPKQARSYKISPDLDLAVIECPADLDARPLSLATRELNPGAEVYVLGFPLGVANVISRGIVGAVEDNYFLFDASISSGNSGGPVVNRMGEVVGVATMGSRSTDQAVVQNLNVGIRVAAIPRLQLFADPLLRISNVSDRIRETEKFIEEGFLHEDFLTLAELLQFDYFKALRVERGFETDEWEQKSTENEERRRVWQSKHGVAIDGVKRWIAFLGNCEARIDAIPAAFAGLGNDPLLAQFLKDERSFKLADQVNATPETLSRLARIGADHWLARLEDLRYRLEWLVQYSKLPSQNELTPLDSSAAEPERPDIRLRFAITGNRETDLQQYRKTMLQWSSRSDVFNNLNARISDGIAKTHASGSKTQNSATSVADAVESERLHGLFLGQVSSMWQYLAIAAGDRGDIDQAVQLIRRDLRGRPLSRWSGAMLGKYLVFAGRFNDAWQAYSDYFLTDASFDAFEIRQRRGIMQTGLAALEIVEGIEPPDAKKFPEVVQHIAEWNRSVNRVQRRDLQTLGSVKETVSSDWFEGLDDFSKLRVLLYYHFARPRGKDLEHFNRTGKVLSLHEQTDQREEFEAALKTSKAAETLWERTMAERKIDFPL